MYHVDYWDYNGWKDPFGSSQWTVRQKGYVELFNLDTMFTPHVVVQGVKQCIGNDEDAVMDCIKGVSRLRQRLRQHSRDLHQNPYKSP